MNNFNIPKSQSSQDCHDDSLLTYSGTHFSACFIFGFCAAAMVGIALAQVGSPWICAAGAILAAIWGAWPFYQWDCREHDSFMHPPARRYKLALKPAFGRVHELLNERVFFMRDRWHITTANTASRRIVASMSFVTDVGLGDRKQTSLSLVQMQLQFEPDAQGCSIKFDFNADSQATYGICIAVVNDTIGTIEQALGGGMAMPDTTSKWQMPAPGWWLIVSTAVFAGWLLLDLMGVRL
jgi:hypothetical protein